MTDRELLELAAKAAGLNYSSEYGCYFDDEYEQGRDWNPITDDGDAFRLAVKLHICTLFPMHGDRFPQCGAGQVGSSSPACMEPHDPDPCAATRRAVVRAAAEVGRNMK